MIIVCILITLTASVLGSVSGLGGGVIIKPLMDLLGWFSISSISFMSAATVLSMSIVTIVNSRRTGVVIEKSKSTWLALGSVAGGLSGKWVFDLIKGVTPHENMVGLIQSTLLIGIILFVFFSMRNWERIPCHHVSNPSIIFAAGLFLGFLAAFLGIGGGPLNVTVLMFLFSMDAKTAALNSIYIVLFSQISSLGFTFLTRTVPDVPVGILIAMCIGGISGGYIGSYLSGKLNNSQVFRVFNGIMLLVIGINVINIIRFSGILH